MSFLKNKWIFLLLNILLSFALFLIFAPQYRLVDFINSSFYVAGFYVFLFIFLFIVSGRFFDGLIFGLRKFSFRKSTDHLSATEEKPLPSEMVNRTFYQFIAFQGLALIIIQIILLVVYYVI